jgi:hypothetical protein
MERWPTDKGISRGLHVIWSVQVKSYISGFTWDLKHTERVQKKTTLSYMFDISYKIKCWFIFILKSKTLSDLSIVLTQNKFKKLT